MSTLSPRVLAICHAHWRTTPAGRVANDCCAGCPLFRPCSAPIAGPLTTQSIRAHAEALERVALTCEAA